MDMSVKLTLEIVEKGLQNLQKMDRAMRGLNSSTAAANGSQAASAARAEQNARKAAAATHQATAAINAQAKAEKAASVVADAAATKRAAEIARRREAYRQFDKEERLRRQAARDPYWGQYWENKNGMKAAEDAAKAAAAQKKMTDAVKQTGDEAVKTEGKLRRLVRAIANAPWGAVGTAAGAAIGRAMGKAIGDNVKSRVKDALQGAWNSAKGGALGLMSNGRAAAGNGFYQARTGLSVAGANALSNAQSAIDVENRLRPDLGSDEAARAMRQYGDQWGKSAPFRTEDTRAALLELARGGIDPKSGIMNMLGDVAANRAKEGETMQSVAAAWAAANRGDYSSLRAFGFESTTDSEGKSFVSTIVNDKVQKIALDAENSAKTLAELRTAIEARFSGQMGRRGMTPEGLAIRAQNNWDAFTGKVMDTGPMAFITDKMKELVGYSDQLGENGLDALAASIGGRIKEGLTEIEAKLMSIWDKLQGMVSAVDPIVQAFGGWGNIVTALVALPFLAYVSSIITALGVLASGVSALIGLFAALASPIGLVVAGIAAVAAGAYYVYQNWDTVGPWLSAQWEKIKALFSDWNPLAALQAAFGPVIAWIEEWGGKLFAAFEKAIGKVQGFVEGAWTKIAKVWENIKGAVSDAASWVGLGGDKNPEAAKNANLIRQGMGASEANQQLGRLRDLLAEVQSAVAAFSILPALQTAIGAAEGYLAGISFHSHGAAMMETLAAGMRSRAEAAVAAVREVTQQIRDHLPHSPAKVGPLSDLHQIRFSETLAMGIQAGPAVAAVQDVVGQMRAAAGAGVGISTLRGNGGAGDGAGGAGGGATSVTYSPSITINGSSLDREGLLSALRQHAYEAQQILTGAQRDRDRLAYG